MVDRVYMVDGVYKGYGFPICTPRRSVAAVNPCIAGRSPLGAARSTPRDEVPRKPPGGQSLLESLDPRNPPPPASGGTKPHFKATTSMASKITSTFLKSRWAWRG
jgi:hypothetical protein